MKNPTTMLLFLLTTISLLLFIGAIHSIVTPFLLAAFVAYMLSPLIRVLTDRFHFGRLAAVILLFTVGIFVFGFAAARFTILLTSEVRELSFELRKLNQTTLIHDSGMPYWMQVGFSDLISSLRTGSILAPNRLWPYFSGALSGVGSIFVFLVATFYFLKDGRQMAKSIIKVLPESSPNARARMLSRGSYILKNYLRGQFMLVLLMSTVSWIVLAILHVKYALILGIFTGLAEIVPIIGPVAAGAVAVLVAFFDGVPTLALPPFFQGVVIASIYFLLRQLEDIFVIPQVMGKVTNMHPLFVLFAVLIGGHLWGVLGMIFAVPIIALFRVLISEMYHVS